MKPCQGSGADNDTRDQEDVPVRVQEGPVRHDPNDFGDKGLDQSVSSLSFNIDLLLKEQAAHVRHGRIHLSEGVGEEQWRLHLLRLGLQAGWKAKLWNGRMDPMTRSKFTTSRVSSKGEASCTMGTD